jgi:two-component system, OmpR family, phosphate regulon sensor histidine kinase PhoR
VFHSIRWRITLPFLLLSLFSLLSLGLVLSNVLRQTYLDNLEANLAGQARLAADVVGPLLQGGSSRADLDAVARHWAGILEARVTFVALDGTVLGESHDARTDMENHRSRPEIAAAFATGQGSSTRFSQTVGYEMMYTAVTILQDGQPLGVVRLAVPLQEVTASVVRVQRILAAATLVVIAFTFLLAGLISYRTTRPVRQLTQAVRQMTDSPWTGTPLHTNLPTARDEVGQLAQAFNVMSSKLSEQFQALQAEDAKLAAVLQKMTDGVLLVDQSGRVQLINAAAERLFDSPSASALGRSLIEVTHAYQVVELWKSCQASGQGQSVSFELGRKKLALEGTATPIGPLLPGRTLLLFQDMTGLRRTEAIRRDFISNVSHELRTPLAALKALAETLQDGAINDPPAAQHFLAQMETEIDALSLMVSELLELSRIESGRVPLVLRPVSPSEIVAQACGRLALQAERLHLALVLDCPDDLPPVLADGVRVQQVLVNLLHNAMKFTPEGGQIQVSAELDNQAVRFRVADNGIGIDPADLPRIFERFYKVDRARSGRGTGLGLAIVRHLVEAHGGRIWVESIPGQGSVFAFTIPLA